jgi:predicted Na+-dependent transporter
MQPWLAGAAAALDRFLLLLVLFSATLGIAFPGPGRRLDGANAILITLAVLVFCTGASMTFSDIAALRAASRRMVLVLAVTTVALPASAWLASQLVSGQALRGGVLAAGVAPAEVASVALTGLAGGDAALAAGLLVASTMGTVLLAGPILGLLGAHSTTSPLGLLATLALVVALPLLAGCTTRTLDLLKGRERHPVRILGTVSLLVLLWEVASELHLRVSDARLVAALVLYLACGAGLGWLLATGVPAARRTAILLPTAMRDFAVAAGIAASAFGAPAAAPLGIYGILVLVFGTATVYTIRRRRRPSSALADHHMAVSRWLVWARRRHRVAFVLGHSAATTENIAESRRRPSSPGACDCDQWRRTPSKCAPRRSMARRDCSLRASVLRSTLTTPTVSNAYSRSRSFASALMPVR